MINPFAFGRYQVGPSEPTLVIAEIGINHEGDPALCAWLIEAAARSGADAVKLQIIDADENYAPGTESHKLFSRAWLAPEAVEALFAFARSLGMEPFATVGDMATLAWVERLAPVGHKISSGLLTHLPLITALAKTGRSLIFSTGMSGVSALHPALKAARAAGGRDIAILHCTSIYPAPPATLNLATIPRLQCEFGVPIGFSDHSDGFEAAAHAVILGACIIEKHFTLDVGRPGFDHPVSLEPREFRRMVDGIRLAEQMRGSADKPVTDEERVVSLKSRRVLAARRDVPAGSVLSFDDIGFIRLPPEASREFYPSDLEKLLGRRTLRNVKRYAAFLSADFDPIPTTNSIAPKVLLWGSVDDPSGEELLRASGFRVEVVAPGAAAMRERIVDADAIWVRMPEKLDRGMLEAAGRLKLVVTSGLDAENIDIPTATEMNIVVASNPGYGTISAVEHVAGETAGTSPAATRLAVDQIRAGLSGEIPAHAMNSAAWMRKTSLQDAKL